MIDDSADGPAGTRSRRRFLATATAVGTAAVAGCAGSLLGASGSNGIERVEPSEPRAGTPGEFYALVERNDIPVESLRWDGSDLVLKYDSSATTESESRTEIEVITMVYNENLVKNDAEVDTLYAEITNPFDGQAHGWGVTTEWCERYNAVVEGEEGTDGTNESDTDSEDGTDTSSDDETATDDDAVSDGAGDDAENDSTGDDEAENDGGGGNESESDGTDGASESGNGTAGTEREISAADSAAITLMNNVLNTRVYAEDLED